EDARDRQCAGAPRHAGRDQVAQRLERRRDRALRHEAVPAKLGGMIVVFSDLDGTLLDHKSYSFEPARPALALLSARGIPLILASSKTEAEMRPIAVAMGIDHPMIVENGAGVAFPGEADATSAAPDDGYAALRSVICALPRPLREKF